MPHEFTFESSTLETIDRAMFTWVDKELNLSAPTNKGWKKTPVIWVFAERAHNVKRKKELRDSNGAIIMPVITIERTSAVKDIKQVPFGNMPDFDKNGGNFEIARRIKQDKTANFQRTLSKKMYGQEHMKAQERTPVLDFSHGYKSPTNLIQENVVYQIASMPQPIYMEVSYKIILRTEYQEQMNELVLPMMKYTGNIKVFRIGHDDHSYEAFLEPEFAANNNIAELGEEERRYETEVGVKVHGYLMGGEKNEDKPKVTIRESVTKIQMIRERVTVEDTPDHIDPNKANVGFYRE